MELNTERNTKTIRTSIQFFFWLLVVLSLLAEGLEQYDFEEALIDAIGTSIVIGLSVYINYWQLVPKLLFRKKLAIYFSAVLLLTSSLVLVHWLLDHHIWDYNGSVVLYFLGYLPYLLIYIGLSTLYRYAENSFEVEQRAMRIENERSRFEARMLAGRLHPHFLFNTLSNIYSLAIQKRAETPEMIAGLADLLRYSTSTSNSHQVLIEEELEITQFLIQLYQLRDKESGKVTMDTAIAANVPVPRGILLTLVENAYKHGNILLTSKSWLKISVKATNEVLRISCHNSYASISLNTTKQTDQGSGLKDLKRRLDLEYTDRYTLEVKEQAGEFQVNFS